MKVTKVGAPLEERFRRDGTSYKLWMTDVLSCEKCGTKVAIIEPSQKPISEHFQPDYESKLERYKPHMTVLV
jgi:hypothetical protein